MKEILDSFDTQEIKKSAEKILQITGEGAKNAYYKAKKGYEELDPDVKKAIFIGIGVFAIVIAVAGCFYLLGRKVGREEDMDVEYEEWDA